MPRACFERGNYALFETLGSLVAKKNCSATYRKQQMKGREGQPPPRGAAWDLTRLFLVSVLGAVQTLASTTRPHLRE